eukprot:NODE_69_length_23719_cov_0.556689.p1 type:complete len:806 gc:universal NODE_69_length_23719_cov_0.556689:21179-18762(-)
MRKPEHHVLTKLVNRSKGYLHNKSHAIIKNVLSLRMDHRIFLNFISNHPNRPMISKAKNFIKAEQLKKQYRASDNSSDFNMQVILSSGQFNGISAYDPALEIIAVIGWNCVRFLGQKLEHCISLLEYDQSFKQLQFLNGSGLLLILTNCEFIIIDLFTSIVNHIDIKADRFLVFPIYKLDNSVLSSAFAMFIQNGATTIFNIQSGKIGKFNILLESAECLVLLSNPRNPNQLLVSLNSTARLYDICQQKELINYTVHNITTGTFHPHGTHICLCNSLGLYLFKRESNISIYEHHIQNITKVEWVISSSEYLIITTDVNVTVYQYKQTLVPLYSVDTIFSLFIANNPFFNQGDSILYDFNLAEVHSNMPIASVANEFPRGSVSVMNTSMSFIARLMHQHTILPFNINYSVNVTNVYDQFEVVCIHNEDSISFYQYSTNPGLLLKSVHPLEVSCRSFTLSNELLYVFRDTITIYTLQEEWQVLQEIPLLNVEYLGVHNGIICISNKILHCITCNIPSSDDGVFNFGEVLRNNIHINILSKPFKYQSLMYLYNDYYLGINDSSMDLIKFDIALEENEIIQSFNYRISAQPSLVYHEATLFVQLNELLCIQEKQVTTIKSKYDGLMALDSMILGINKVNNGIKLTNLMNPTQAKLIKVPWDFSFITNNDHLWVIINHGNLRNINILGANSLIELKVNSIPVKRKAPTDGKLTQLLGMFFAKEESNWEETDYEQDDGFYYDCLLDLEIIFNQNSKKEQDGGNTKTANPFALAKNALQDRGEQLQVLDKKFDDLEQRGKSLLDLAKNLNKK